MAKKAFTFQNYGSEIITTTICLETVIGYSLYRATKKHKDYFTLVFASGVESVYLSFTDKAKGILESYFKTHF